MHVPYYCYQVDQPFADYYDNFEDSVDDVIVFFYFIIFYVYYLYYRYLDTYVRYKVDNNCKQDNHFYVNVFYMFLLALVV